VELAALLREFAASLKGTGYVELGLCGIVIFSASTIHRMKTQRLLQEDEPSVPKPKPDLLTPPPVSLPIKPGTLTTTIQELVMALEAALTQAARQTAKAAPPPTQENRLILAEVLVKIEQELEEFVEYIRRILAEKGSVRFSELICGKTRTEAAKIFILLLFGAARDILTLLQEEVSDDLVIGRGGG